MSRLGASDYKSGATRPTITTAKHMAKSMIDGWTVDAAPTRTCPMRILTVRLLTLSVARTSGSGTGGDGG